MQKARKEICKSNQSSACFGNGAPPFACMFNTGGNKWFYFVWVQNNDDLQDCTYLPPRDRTHHIAIIPPPPPPPPPSSTSTTNYYVSSKWTTPPRFITVLHHPIAALRNIDHFAPQKGQGKTWYQNALQSGPYHLATTPPPREPLTAPMMSVTRCQNFPTAIFSLWLCIIYY